MSSRESLETDRGRGRSSCCWYTISYSPIKTYIIIRKERDNFRLLLQDLDGIARLREAAEQRLELALLCDKVCGLIM